MLPWIASGSVGRPRNQETKKSRNQELELPTVRGEPTRGFDTSPERVTATARFFQAGEAELEVVQAYTSGELVVLVAIERSMERSAGCPTRTGRCA